MREDPIALLLPDADEAELAHARRLTTFLRLLADDARGEALGSQQRALARARADLDRERTARITEALEELVRAHLEHELGRDEASWFGAERLAPAQAWRVLDEARDDLADLPAVPEPGEPALRVAERVVESLARVLGDGLRTALWRARLTLVRDGVEAGLASLRALAEGRAGTAQDERDALQPALVAAVAECHLTRGAVARAREWLDRHTDLYCRSRRLSQLDAWTRVLLGGEACAVRGGGPLPAPLCELREREPALVAALPGPSASPARGERWRPRAEPRPLRRREDLGASAWVVFAFDADGARVVHADVAPALRGRLRAWLEERALACTEPGTPEHELLVEVRARALHGAELAATTLGGSGTRAAFLEPIVDGEGEVRGWCHLELEHLAAPSRRGLRELAAGWRERVLAAARSESLAAPRERDDDGEQRRACAATFRALVAATGARLGRRHWWGFVVTDGRPELVAEGGAALDPRHGTIAPSGPGTGGRALARSCATGGVVRFEEPRPGLALGAATASGAVLPVRDEDGVVGCLVLESARRGDARARDVSRWARIAAEHATALRVARFSDHHERTFGTPVSFPAQRTDFRRFARQVRSAARASVPLVICGPSGGGKRTLARWVAFEGAGSVPVELTCTEPWTREDLDRAAREARDGVLVVRALEHASGAQQAALRALAESSSRDSAAPRLVTCSRVAPAELAASGALRDDLAHLLERARLDVPALRDRREDLPGLCAALVERIAREESLRAPELDDELVLLLWRQGWSGNVRELEGVLTRLVLASRGEPVGAELARTVLGDGGACGLRRLPSRRPRRRDLAAALRTTRTVGGRVNKTRAAACLGWDPDTLVARLRDAGLDGETPPPDDAWCPR